MDCLPSGTTIEIQALAQELHPPFHRSTAIMRLEMDGSRSRTSRALGRARLGWIAADSCRMAMPEKRTSRERCTSTAPRPYVGHKDRLPLAPRAGFVGDHNKGRGCRQSQLSRKADPLSLCVDQSLAQSVRRRERSRKDVRLFFVKHGQDLVISFERACAT